MNEVSMTPEEVIQEFISEIGQQRRIWDNLAAANNRFGPLSIDSCRVNEASCWIYGTANPVELAELQKWELDAVPHSKIANRLALEFYRIWEKFIEEGGGLPNDKGAFCDFVVAHLPKPQKSETLRDYLIRIVRDIERLEQGPQRRRRVFYSFVDKVRRLHAPEDTGFIESIIPANKEIIEYDNSPSGSKRETMVIPKIKEQAYPISEDLTGEIIKALAYKCSCKRPNACVDEVLALCWVCLIASRLKLQTSLEMIQKMPLGAIRVDEAYPQLFMPTKFGHIKVRVSAFAAKFLQSIVKKSPSRRKIFESDIYSLRRVLNSVVQSVVESLINSKAHSENEKDDLRDLLGKISFLSFLSPPHGAGVLKR